jgi:hypothetical protein
MPFQLTRPAANAAPYSRRSAKLGAAFDTLPRAMSAALKRTEPAGSAKVTITDTATGLWASVGRLTYANGPHAGTHHIEMSIPAGWAGAMTAWWNSQTSHTSSND